MRRPGLFCREKLRPWRDVLYCRLGEAMRSKVQSGPRPETEFLRMLGERVRQERSRRGMTRKELAKSAYVSERFLAQLETGHGNISIIRLRRIAHGMDLGVERVGQGRNGEGAGIAGTVALLGELKPE